MRITSENAVYLHNLLLQHPELAGDKNYDYLLENSKEEAERHNLKVEQFNDTSKPKVKYIGKDPIYDWGDGTYRVIEDLVETYRVINKSHVVRVMGKHLFKIIEEGTE